MSRPITTKTREMPPEIIHADEADRLEYLALLLLEIAEEELRTSEEALCNPS